MKTLIKSTFAKYLKFHWGLLFILSIISFFSLQTIESAARHFDQGGSWFAQRQLLWVVLGVLLCLAISVVDYHKLKRLIPYSYILGILSLIACIFWGNATHQIDLGIIAFQPVQFAILTTLLFCSYSFEQVWEYDGRWSMIAKLLIIGIFATLPLILILLIGDTGTALVWLPSLFIMLLITNFPWRYLSLILITLIALLPILYYFVLPLAPERPQERIKTYIATINQEKVDINNDAYAQHYISLAIGKAGLRGTGLNSTVEDGSIHAQKYIPWKTAHNDFIFAVFAEERGFLGSLLLLILYASLLIALLFISIQSQDIFASCFTNLAAFWFFSHIFQNISMCLLLMPITGVPLPFMSYSGTFTITCFAIIGIVQSIWIHRKQKLADKSSKIDLLNLNKFASLK